MVDEKKIHLKSADQFGYDDEFVESRTACGKGELEEFVSVNTEDVTCYNCMYTEEYENRENLEDATETHNKLMSDNTSEAKDKQIGGAWYKDYSIQPIEFVLENEDQLHPSDAFLLNNVLKYICRHREKGGEDDLDKAIHYIELVKEHTYD